MMQDFFHFVTVHQNLTAVLQMCVETYLQTRFLSFVRLQHFSGQFVTAHHICFVNIVDAFLA